MKHETMVSTTDCPCCNELHGGYLGHHHKRISWSAILVGALVGIGLSFLLNLFGLAIGLSTSTTNSTGANVIAFGGLLGVVIGLIASMLTAGYAAGYLGRFCCPERNLGIIYGFTTWTVALLLMAFIGAKMGNYVTAYSNAISNNSTVTLHQQDATKTEPAKVGVTKTTETPTKVTETTVQAPQAALAWGAFTLFGLFFLGALASCIGAHCGMMSCKRDDEVVVKK